MYWALAVTKRSSDLWCRAARCRHSAMPLGTSSLGTVLLCSLVCAGVSSCVEDYFAFCPFLAEETNCESIDQSLHVALQPHGGEWGYTSVEVHLLLALTTSTACRSSCAKTSNEEWCVAPTEGPNYDETLQVLVAAYKATEGSQWSNASGWLDHSISYCLWYGVNCDVEGNVSALFLPYNNLRGTLPDEPLALHKLHQLHIFENPALSGSFPANLPYLENIRIDNTALSGTMNEVYWSPELVSISMRRTRFSGTIPDVPFRQLTMAGFTFAPLSGTVPQSLFAHSSLKDISAGYCTLSGTLADVALGTSLNSIGMGSVLISGSLPYSVTNLTSLVSLLFNDSPFSGTAVGNLDKLKTLNLYSMAGITECSGMLPAGLSKLTRLHFITAFETKISGTIPDLAALSSLSGFGTGSSQISGTLASWLGNATHLTDLILNSQRLSGTLPNYFSNLTSLRALLLHNNQLEGTLPPLDKLVELVNLTLFNLGLSGNVMLASIKQMAILMIHRNRFSCQIKVDDHSIDVSSSDKVLLVLPGTPIVALLARRLNELDVGNTFSTPVPNCKMKDVDFLYYSGWWHSILGHGTLRIVLASLSLLGIVALFMHNEGGVRRMLDLGEMEHALVRIRMTTSKGLLGWCLVLSPLFMVYIVGAGEYQCGKPYLYATAAYLRNDMAMEWAVAVGACISSALAGWCIFALRVHVQHHMIEEIKVHSVDMRQQVYLWMLWIPISLILSIPMVIYILSTALPGENNVLALGSTSLLLMQNGAGPMLYFISALMIPPLARLLLKLVVGSHNSAVSARLMTGARFIVSLLVPFATILTLDQQCFAFWLKLWQPCQDNSSQFDIDIVADLTIVDALGPITVPHSFKATRYNDICAPTYNYGECPRAVISTLGPLIYNKLLFTALVGPVLVLLLNSKTWRRAQECVVRNALRADTYEATTDLDTESAGIVMLLQLLLTFGFVIPSLVPLGCLAFVLHSVAFQLAIKHQGARLMYEARPPMGSLWFSLVSGLSLVVWLFVECVWSGRILVLGGPPIMAMIGFWYWRRNANTMSAECGDAWSFTSSFQLSSRLLRLDNDFVGNDLVSTTSLPNNNEDLMSL